MFIKCFLKCLAKPKRSVIRSLCFTPGSNKADLRHEQRFRFLEYVIYVLLQVLPFLDVLNDHWAYQQGTPQERGAISRWFGHYSCLFWRRRWHPTPVLLPENPMDRGAWWAAVHGVVKSQTRLKRLSSSSSSSLLVLAGEEHRNSQLPLFWKEAVTVGP